MVQAKGSSGQLLFGPRETTYGTTPDTPSAIKMPIISANLEVAKANVEAKEIRGRRDAAGPGRGNAKVSGSAVVPVDILNFGYWLRMLLGDPVTSGTEAPYTHVYQVGNAIPSFPLEIGFTDISRYSLFNGSKANSMALKFDAGSDENLTASIDIAGKKETPGDTPMDTDPDVLDFERFKISDLAIEEGGSTIANVTAIDLTCGNNLDTSMFVIGGGGTVDSLPEGTFVVTGNLTATFIDDTLLAKARDFTKTSLKMTLASGTSSLELKINELKYGYKSPGLDGPQGIKITLPFSAYYDNPSVDESIIQATLINGQTSYAG